MYSRDHGKFDSTQLKALKEYLADQDERRGLMAYMEKGKTSPDVKEKLYSEFSETEKYMWTMMDVNDAPEKFDTLLFRSNFKTRFEDISSAIQTLNAACDELRSSPKLRKLMAIILTVVNQINTGGEGKMAAGFTLDALLKLNEVCISLVFLMVVANLVLSHSILPRPKLLIRRRACFITLLSWSRKTTRL